MDSQKEYKIFVLTTPESSLEQVFSSEDYLLNLDNKDFLETEKGNIVKFSRAFKLDYDGMKDSTLVLAGSQQEDEEQVKEIKRCSWAIPHNKKIIVARFSIFYGREIPEHSNEKISDMGYSLDIFRGLKEDTAFSLETLLRSDDFLEAIEKRDLSQINESLNRINEKLKAKEHEPVLILPYFHDIIKGIEEMHYRKQ